MIITLGFRIWISGCQEFVRDDGSLACYVIAAEEVDYHEALESCSSRGFNLAEIQGPVDQENLKTMTQPFKVTNFIQNSG